MDRDAELEVIRCAYAKRVVLVGSFAPPPTSAS
jgi:hypothetical protein